MKLAAVIVFFYPSEINISNITIISKSVDKIYVIDNSDDKIVRLKTTKKIEYIKLGNNKGIAYALNLGAQKAIKEQYKFLLTLDQDTQMDDETINKMKEFLINNKDKKIGLISPYQVVHKKSFLDECEQIEDRIEVMTSGNIIDLNIYQKIGGFKEWLFIDCVDTDYCMNLHKNGYRVVRLNYLKVKHELGNLVVHKLFGKEYPCYNHNPIRRYYILRNNLYINDMYKDLFPDYCAWLLRVQKGQVKRILVFEKNKFQKLVMMLKGYYDYKKGRKGKYNRR